MLVMRRVECYSRSRKRRAAAEVQVEECLRESLVGKVDWLFSAKGAAYLFRRRRHPQPLRAYSVEALALRLAQAREEEDLQSRRQYQETSRLPANPYSSSIQRPWDGRRDYHPRPWRFETWMGH